MRSGSSCLCFFSANWVCLSKVIVYCTMFKHQGLSCLTYFKKNNFHIAVIHSVVNISPLCVQYSICSEPLIELSNPGASGSLFFVTSDDEFIIKTVQHKEAEFLQKLLPGYYMVNKFKCQAFLVWFPSFFLLIVLWISLRVLNHCPFWGVDFNMALVYICAFYMWDRWTF